MDNKEIEARAFVMRLACWLLYLIFALLLSTKATADPDLWGYMAFGRLYWESGTFPYKDIFAYLPTLDLWVYHEWLTGVLFYYIYQHWGAAGLQIIKYSFLLFTMWLIYLSALRRGADFSASILLLFFIWGTLSLGSFPVRAQIFTYFFFALTLFILEYVRISGKKKYLWFMAPIQCIWCNLHGGFIAGLGLISLYIVGELLNRNNKLFLFLTIVFILSVLSTLINPYGIEYWQYMVKAIRMPRPEITEWSSVYTAYEKGYIGYADASYFVVAAVFAALLILWERDRDITIYVALGVTLFIGVKNIRHMVFFLFLIGVYLPAALKRFLIKMKSDFIIQKVHGCFNILSWESRFIIIILLSCFFVTKLLTKNPLSINLPAEPEQNLLYYPTGAVTYIQTQNLSGNILTSFNWGEYLIWTLYPACRVSLDGRYETVYPDYVSQEYFDCIAGKENWRQFLNKYPPDMILIEKNTKLYFLLKAESQWKQVYYDAGSALFSPGNS